MTRLDKVVALLTSVIKPRVRAFVVFFYPNKIRELCNLWQPFPVNIQFSTLFQVILENGICVVACRRSPFVFANEPICASNVTDAARVQPELLALVFLDSFRAISGVS